MFFSFRFSMTLFLSLTSLEATSPISFISREGEARWAIQDYVEANRLYEELLDQPLLDWQRARLDYNLGTLFLAQRRPMEAFAFFQKIEPSHLLLPQLGQNLLMNHGIGDLQQFSSKDHFGLSSLFIRQAKMAFREAQTMNCERQKQEERLQNSFVCWSDPVLDTWMKQANVFFQQHREQVQLNWLKEASKEQLATLLSLQLQEIEKRLEKQISYAPISSSILSYFHSQLSFLMPLWEELQGQSFSKTQKEVFNQAIDSYFKAREESQPKQLLMDLSLARDALSALGFKQEDVLQRAILHYQVHLLSPSLSLSSLKNLQKTFDDLTVSKEHTETLRSIQSAIKKSLIALESNQLLEAQFFFIAGFSKAESLLDQPQWGAKEWLRKGMDQSKRVLFLSFLLEELEKKGRNESKKHQLLKEEQEEVFLRAKHFIPAALEEQKHSFSLHQCQASPWERVIPLFDSGDQAMQNARQELNAASFAFPSFIGLQEQTIENWENALQLLLHPPVDSKSPSPSASSIHETLRLLQEAYDEDQPHSEQQIKDLHTW